MDPITTTLATQLATVTARNTVNTITDRIKVARANKDGGVTINALTEIINDLQSDKNALVTIAQSYEQEFISQKITEKDLKHITDTAVPLLEKFMPDQKETIDQMKSLLSVEMLTIMQLLGFNYKRAIGEPLTSLLQKTIESKIPADPIFNQRFQLALIELAKDPEAIKRYEGITGVKVGSAR